MTTSKPTALSAMLIAMVLLLILLGGLGCADESESTKSDVDAMADAHTPDSAMDAAVPNESWHEACPIDTIEQRMIDVGDVQLNVACRGDGPTVVFLHGFPEFHYGWHRVMDALASEFRLVAPDQRGYNLSDKPEAVEDYVLPNLTADIMNLLPLISAEPVILVAHDWGGPVGWLVAHTPGAHIRGFVSTNGPHPVRFVDLIANDPAQRMASGYMELFRSPAGEQFMSPEALTAQFQDMLSPEALEIYQVAWAQPGAITGGLNWYRANTLTEDSIENLMDDRLAEVPVPSVVMWGLDDEFVLSQNAEGLEAFTTDLQVETFPGVDHWIAHRIPEEIARVIRELHLRTTSE